MAVKVDKTLKRLSIFTLSIFCLIYGLSAQTSLPSKKFESGFRSFEITFKDSESKEVTKEISIWYPTDEKAVAGSYIEKQSGLYKKDARVAKGKHPLIIFSHGLWSHPQYSAFLTEELSREGFIVAGILHNDGSTENKKGWQRGKTPNFLDPESWDENTCRDRRDDMKGLLSYLIKENSQKGSFLSSRINNDAIGAMGHSLGGYTVTGLIGGWPSWQENRIKAALLLSPYEGPYDEHNHVKDIKTPVMIQGGTADFTITPFLGKFYRTLKAPKYFPVFKDESHFGWVYLPYHGKTTVETIKDGNAAGIVKYSSLFMKAYLLNCPDSKKELKTSAPELARYKFEQGGN